MPRWTKEDLDAYELRRKTKADRQTPSAQPQRTVRHESVGEVAREEEDSSRIHVRVISFRSRLLDPDNLCPKYFIDCLRYAGIIPDDRPQDITLEVSQSKCKRKDERTEIEILWHMNILDQDRNADMQTLLQYFTNSRSNWVSGESLDMMGLNLTGRALCNLGLLSPRTMGRWNDGYEPAGQLRSLLKNNQAQ